MMGMKKSCGLVFSLILIFSTGNLMAQHNPGGWIRASAWNMLFLDQDAGCGGGGIDRISSADWAAPFDIHEEDPQAGDEWDVDFNIAQSRSWTLVNLAEVPTWVTTESLGANGFDDMVNFDAYVGAQGASTDNIMSISTTYVENTTAEAINVQVCTTSDDSIRADINNNMVTAVSACRGSGGDCAETNCGVLDPGMNKITTYVWEGGGGWNMRIALEDLAGNKLNDDNDLGIIFHGSGEGDFAGQIVDHAGDCDLPPMLAPSGWIQASAWNMLLLDQDGGCGGGGVARMTSGDWTLPLDIHEEDPRPGEEWDINFPGAQSRGWTLNQVGDLPTWISTDFLNDNGINVNGADDLVNFDAYVAALGANTDNLVAISTTYVENTTEDPFLVEVCTSSDDSIRVDVNNYIVVAVSACRGSAGDCQERNCAELTPGMNKITTYVWEGGGGWNMRFGLRDRDTGAELTDAAAAAIGLVYHGNGVEDELEGQVLDVDPECSLGVAAGPGDPVDPVDPVDVIDAPVNPNGWIRNSGWTMLFLDQDGGCGGGGLGRMEGNWVAPYDMAEENPRPGEEWDVDFAEAESRSWTATILGDIPTWFSRVSLGEAGINLGADDLVNFDSMAGQFGISTDNIMAVATTYVENTTDEPMTVFVCTASDDSIRVDINNSTATLVSACRGSGGDCQETNCGVLEPGVNKITAYVWEGGGGWNMRVGLRDISGQVLNDGNGDVAFLGTGEEDELEGQILDEDAGCDLGVNPAGWIRTDGWNMLLSLLNPAGCGGGGVGLMEGNWVDPYDLMDEDPQAGDTWPDIDFTLGFASGFDNGGLTEEPTWVTKRYLDEEFGTDLPTGDMVDFQAIAAYLSAAGVTQFPVPNDNVTAIATTYVINQTDDVLPVDICTASDDSIKVIVNEELVTNVSACRGSSGACQDTRPAVLEPGLNKITVQVWEGGGGWNFRLGIRESGSNLNLNGLNPLVEFIGATIDGDGPVDPPPPAGPRFVRGDADDNGVVNLTDAIFNLNYLFIGGAAPTCMDSSDADNSGTLQLTDGIFLLNYLFIGGAPPPDPGRECGLDPEEPADGLGCETFESCP